MNAISSSGPKCVCRSSGASLIIADEYSDQKGTGAVKITPRMMPTALGRAAAWFAAYQCFGRGS
jgi:hypothetical protein